jgi:hypothetical protein
MWFEVGPILLQEEGLARLAKLLLPFAILLLLHLFSGFMSHYFIVFWACLLPLNKGFNYWGHICFTVQ